MGRTEPPARPTGSPKPGLIEAGETRLFFQWDAWNRLVRVLEDTNADGDLDAGTDKIVAEYRYDGRTFRIAKLVPHGGPAAEPTHWDRTDYYYNDVAQPPSAVRWPCLKEQFGPAADTASELIMVSPEFLGLFGPPSPLTYVYDEAAWRSWNYEDNR